MTATKPVYPPDLQKSIDAANARAVARQRKAFAKKASDSNMLDHLVKTARVAVDSYFGNSRDVAAAMKELRTILTIAEKRTR